MLTGHLCASSRHEQRTTGAQQHLLLTGTVAHVSTPQAGHRSQQQVLTGLRCSPSRSTEDACQPAAMPHGSTPCCLSSVAAADRIEREGMLKCSGSVLAFFVSWSRCAGRCLQTWERVSTGGILGSVHSIPTGLVLIHSLQPWAPKRFSEQCRCWANRSAAHLVRPAAVSGCGDTLRFDPGATQQPCGCQAVGGFAVD
jgi:hypothetical protein